MSLTDQTIALRGMRGMIAKKMVQSLQEAAQLTHHASCDVSRLIAVKDRFAKEGLKISIEDLVNEAVVRVLGQHPLLNGVTTGEEVKLFAQINLGIAIALAGNLLVAPAIMNAGEMDLAELRNARRDLADRARRNALTMPEMTKGSFTVSNLGLTRVEHFTPILNYPQIAILGIGRTVERLVLNEAGHVEVRSFMGLSLTFDHRAVDGAPAAEFLTALCNDIEAAG